MARNHIFLVRVSDNNYLGWLLIALGWCASLDLINCVRVLHNNDLSDYISSRPTPLSTV